MNKFNKYRTLIITIISITISIFSILLFLLDDRFLQDKKYIFISVASVTIIEFIFVLVERLTQNKKDLYNVYNKEVVQLNDLIKYNKQREEIEEEIRSLTKQLENSNVAQYVDVNRLAFSGQNSNYVNNSIDYENFLKQFGLQKEKLIIKEGTAAFLSPFDKKGDMLFNTCQSVLGKIDVFLRRTDNIVEKDDILMNIVSLIIQSEFILVNIDGRNPNVYYELGIAHALGKPTILLSKAKYTLNEVGFDIRQKRIVIYENEKDLETELLAQISMLRRS